MEHNLYCRLSETGQIIEYPVYHQHIINRHHPLEWYTPVFTSPLPAIDEFQVIVSTPLVAIDANGKHFVTLQHKVTMAQYESLVTQLPENDAEIDLGSPLVTAIKSSIITKIEANLNAFAAQKQYGSEKTEPIEAAAKYAVGTDPRFGPEGRYIVDKVGETWRSLYAYMEKVTLGTEPFPREFTAVQQQLPVLNWDDVDYTK